MPPTTYPPPTALRAALTAWAKQPASTKAEIFSHLEAIESATLEDLDRVISHTRDRVKHIENKAWTYTSDKTPSVLASKETWSLYPDFVESKTTGPESIIVGKTYIEYDLNSLTGLDRKIGITLPATVPFFGHGNILVKGKALEETARSLQGIALRLLASIRPGLLRFTMCDALGLGSNFKALSALNDFVKGAMVWSDPRDIREALSELKAHMAVVTQKYLTNKYDTLEAFNKDAGEVAEPYRVLLVSNFPRGFTEDACADLLSIAQNGPQLGVYVLLSWDTGFELPRDFARNKGADRLSEGAIVLDTDKNRLLKGDQLLTKHNFSLLEQDQDGVWIKGIAERIVDEVNKQTETNKRVDIRFDRLLPTDLWSGNTSNKIDVPIGLSGTKHHMFTLGVGTNHHALVGGKTGSGKSVLLHAIITSLCAHYSPNELQLYLLDFKEGVEFATYTTLPHAKVVAIEGEPEFGISVLKSLIDEIDRRGKIFKQHGVQNLTGFRSVSETPMPRILLLADEFQVLFEQKETKQKALFYLEKLAREGRSFGVHLLLASQSYQGLELDGSTMAQFGVRIALQMSRADSQKLLSADNEVAHLLERPGQGIYNASGGNKEANINFQAAHLTNEERVVMVKQFVQMQSHEQRRSPIVFDGTLASKVELNHVLLGHTQHGPASSPKMVPLFVGDPVEIRDQHTHFRLRRQSRSNLLLCGQDETDAMSVFLSAAWSFMAGYPRATAKLRVLDLTPVDSDLAGTLDLLARFPGDVRIGGRRDVTAFLEEVAAVVTSRDDEIEGTDRTSPWMLAIFGLQSARELQKEGIRTPPALDHLHKILLHGPDLGVYTLAWVNAYSRLQNVLDGAKVREFGGLVALQGGESDKLFGAGSLRMKPHYGYFGDAESPDLVKFRTYGNSIFEWIKKTPIG